MFSSILPEVDAELPDHKTSGCNNKNNEQISKERKERDGVGEQKKGVNEERDGVSEERERWGK